MIPRPRRGFASRLLASTILFGLPTQTLAQEVAPVILLEPILVTARKREEALDKVPASVHVETANMLEDKRVLDGAGALRDVAGASLGIFGDRSNAFVVLRGVGPILTPLSPDDSSVLTFVDGAPLPIGGSYSSSYLDLDRVEIMKGPQNTLFGRNVSGGAINLVPAEPSQDFYGTLRGEIGADGLSRVEAMVNGAILPGLLAGRLAFRRSTMDGYIDNMAGPKLGAEESLVGRGSLLFTPSPETRWLLSLQAEDTKITPTTYVAFRPGGPKLAAQNHTTDDTRLFALASRFEHDFEPLTFTAQTSYSRLSNHNAYNYPDAVIASDFSGLPPEDFLDPATNFIDWRKRDSRLSQEFRLTSPEDSETGWLLGLSLYQDRAQRDRVSEMWYFGPSATGARSYDQTTTGQALFGEVSHPVTERLTLSLGARATHEAKTFEGSFASDGANGAVPFFQEAGKRDYNSLTGRAALSYAWTPDLSTYASVARGYKSGGFALENALIWSGVARQPYDSSSVISYELGGRSSWLGDRLEIDGALFFNDMKKEQMQTWDYVTFTGQNLNLDARSAGFEIDARARLGDHWTLSGGAGYTFSELRNVSSEAAAAQDGLRSGNKLPTVPEWTARAAVEYRTQGEEIGLVGPLADATLHARLAYNHIGARFTDASNFGKLEPAHILSARLGVDWGGGEAYVFGDNLLDKKYMTIKERFGSDAAGDPVFGVSFARGASFGVGLSFRF